MAMALRVVGGVETSCQGLSASVGCGSDGMSCVDRRRRAPPTADADTVAVGVFEGEGDRPRRRRTLAGAARLRRGQALVQARSRVDARRRRSAGCWSGSARATSSTPSARGWPPPARRAGAGARRARSAGSCPHHVGDDAPAALVEGTVLAAYRFDATRPTPTTDRRRRQLEPLRLGAHHDVVGGRSRAAALVAEAVNRARDLQNRPANDLTPDRARPSARASSPAELERLSVEVEGRERDRARGHGRVRRRRAGLRRRSPR